MVVKLAIATLSDCEGCIVSLLDLENRFLDILKNCEIAYAPELADIVKEDWEADVCIVMGCVASKTNYEELKILRKRCKRIVAYGTCAVYGGIPGLSLLIELKDLASIFSEKAELIKKALLRVKPLRDVVSIEYIIPGCPPPEELALKILEAAINSRPQPPLPLKTVCDECPLNSGKEKTMVSVKRWFEASANLDSSKCLLEQGFLCLGFATRAGCKAQCPRAGSICTGCMGFVDEDSIRGLGRFLGGLGTAIKNLDVELLISKLPDPIGLFLRYVLPSVIKVNNDGGKY